MDAKEFLPRQQYVTLRSFSGSAEAIRLHETSLASFLQHIPIMDHVPERRRVQQREQRQQRTDEGTRTDGLRTMREGGGRQGEEEAGRGRGRPFIAADAAEECGSVEMPNGDVEKMKIFREPISHSHFARAATVLTTRGGRTRQAEARPRPPAGDLP